MTKEERELLSKDLCARLPYHPIVYVDENLPRLKLDLATRVWEYIAVNKPCKPYLRSMSSITEEELEELKTLCSIYIPTDSPIIGFEDYGIVVFTHHLTNNTYSLKLNVYVIDWLNAHHFDYRRLINKGLALEALEVMYNIN
jgi:predicted AlkP superfamily phosphohydrolase/phosphomutase